MNEKQLVSPFLTVSDLAIRWKKPSQWVYSNWREIGLRPVAIGKQLRFREEDVITWEVQNQINGNPSPGAFSSREDA